eukprot:CAMPEP_0113934908 /NCGR_PEP_ID=MMETSP1339-20121228/2156_1 /TAXON_ID=94617 /ORGANISM="Fibrocapsa japonica" /LENGTH=196 /DNA_ID=CAMNT_0000936877 /DNA_START=77 /DNA_END=667 /DNA_ORIENTATION=- /assembly_acc=CAM_ASM_000762
MAKVVLVLLAIIGAAATLCAACGKDTAFVNNVRCSPKSARSLNQAAAPIGLQMSNQVTSAASQAISSLLLADEVSSAATKFEPGPIEVGPELWIANGACVLVFLWAAYEFWSRFDVQGRCGVCQGTGLVMETSTGIPLSNPRKCYACGGFVPFVSWRQFFFANTQIGNGGILRRPAKNYEELSAAAKAKESEVEQK